MKYTELENLIGYSFRNKKLLETAITHSSYANDTLGDSRLGNERLEFLGDAVLDAIIGEILFKKYPDKDEGFLTKLRAEIVCERALGSAGLKLGLNKYLRLGAGEEQSGGRTRLSIVADSMEALIAAVYLDSCNDAMVNTTYFVSRLLAETMELAFEGKIPSDNKSRLQEICQSKGITDIKYVIVSESGPDHNKHFEAEVFIDGKECGHGEGRSKKEAETMAAYEAIKLHGGIN